MAKKHTKYSYTFNIYGFISVSCPDSTPKNDQVAPFQSSYTVNTRVSFSCNSGYILEGFRTITCIPNEYYDYDTYTWIVVGVFSKGTVVG